MEEGRGIVEPYELQQIKGSGPGLMSITNVENSSTHCNNKNKNKNKKRTSTSYDDKVREGEAIWHQEGRHGPKNPLTMDGYSVDYWRERMSKSAFNEMIETIHSIRVLPPRIRDDKAMQEYEEQKLELSTAALTFYNDTHRGKEPEYVLDERLENGGGLISTGVLFHINFVAHPVYPPNARKELFFAELLHNAQGLSVRKCEPLGFVGSRSADSGLQGCRFCQVIHHPMDGGFMTGKYVPE